MKNLLKVRCNFVFIEIETADAITEIPIGRLGFPDEVAETVVWMVKTGYVTNKVIGVDGGLFVQ